MVKCVKCKDRKAIIVFSESVMNHIHGFQQKICRECYIVTIEAELIKIKSNLKDQKEALKLERKVGGRRNA